VPFLNKKSEYLPTHKILHGYIRVTFVVGSLDNSSK